MEVFAVMAKRGFRPPTRGQGGPRRAQPRLGQRGAKFGAQAAMPPKTGDNVRCSNCGRKGHTGQDCRQPQLDAKDRPCFNCGKPGHKSAACPEPRKARPKDVRALEDASAGPRQPTLAVTAASAKVLCFMITAVANPPKQQGQQLGDFIGLAANDKRRNNNRFQPLTLSNEVFREVTPKLTLASPPKLTSPALELVNASPGRLPLPLMRQPEPKLVGNVSSRATVQPSALAGEICRPSPRSSSMLPWCFR